MRACARALRVLLLAVLALCLGAAGAQARPDAGPIRVSVAVYLLSLGQFDTASGTFTADFYLSFRCDRPCDAGDFEFMNGRATVLDRQLATPTRQDYRAYATLQGNFDLRRYPFDQHDLNIAIEHKTLPVERLVYRPDRPRSGVAQDLIVTGLELVPGWNTRVEQRYLPIFGQTFSHFTFSVTIRRALLAALLKSLLPSVIITLSGFAALLLHSPDTAQARTAAVGAALVAVVLFHLNMTSSIPPVGYLTFADRFSLVNYLALFLGLVSSVWLLVEASRPGRDPGEIAARTGRISHFFLWFIPAFWLALHLLNLAFF